MILFELFFLINPQTATGRQLIAALVQELRTMLGNSFKGKSASFIEIQRAMESDTVTVNPDDLEEALRPKEISMPSF